MRLPRLHEPTSEGYDSRATVPAACPPVISGCTDLAAPNCLPEATVDDGSCTVAGCNNTNATNFDVSATQDDG